MDPKLKVVFALVLLAIAMIGLGLIMLQPKGDPLAQFSTKRDCTFLVMPDVSRAVCVDGTVWNVQQVGAPAPLP